MDTNGRPLSQHETVVQQQEKVENIPWDQWAVSETKPDKERFAKLLIELAMANMHAHTWNTIPIALVRKGSAIQALTTKRVEVGELVVTCSSGSRAPW